MNRKKLPVDLAGMFIVFQPFFFFVGQIVLQQLSFFPSKFFQIVGGELSLFVKSSLENILSIDFRVDALYWRASVIDEDEPVPHFFWQEDDVVKFH